MTIEVSESYADGESKWPLKNRARRLALVRCERQAQAQQEAATGYLAGLAIAALRHFPVEPGSLDFLAGRRFADRLDRSDLCVADAVNRRDTRTDGLAVDMHSARAAQRHAAAQFRAAHTEQVAQHPEKRCISIDVDGMTISIDRDIKSHDDLLF
jgi:hypothetical protein